MKMLLLSALAVASVQPPAWIQRSAVTRPIVTWREADVLGTPVVEGIVVSRDLGLLAVSVVDSRFDPPRVVAQRDVPGKRVRWLRAARRDGLTRNEIALDVRRHGGDTAYLLRVDRRLTLRLVRTLRGPSLSPDVFSR